MFGSDGSRASARILATATVVLAVAAAGCAPSSTADDNRDMSQGPGNELAAPAGSESADDVGDLTSEGPSPSPRPTPFCVDPVADVMTLGEYLSVDEWIEIKDVSALSLSAADRSPLLSGRGVERYRTVDVQGPARTIRDPESVVDAKRFVASGFVADALDVSADAADTTLFVGVQVEKTRDPFAIRVVAVKESGGVSIPAPCTSGYESWLDRLASVDGSSPADLVLRVISGELGEADLEALDAKSTQPRQPEGVFDPEYVSDEVLESLRQVAVVIKVPAESMGSAVSICTASSLGLNECSLALTDTVELTAFAPFGEQLEVVFVDFASGERIGKAGHAAIPTTGERFSIDVSSAAPNLGVETALEVRRLG